MGEILDRLIRGARVVDGSGGPVYPADVAIAGGRIVAVGDLGPMAAAETIEADGLHLAPGFIDAHTHDDRALLSDPDMTPKVSQGVTTVVVGNCGVSLSPLVLDRRPPPPLDLLGDQSWYRFGRVADYTAALAAAPAAVNAAFLVGHQTLRVGVMDRLDRPATATETLEMRRRLEEGLRAGALGLSTGLAYEPAAAATTEEVIALAEALAAHGGLYATHLRDEGDRLAEAVEEALLIGRVASAPVVLSHHKAVGAANHGKVAATLARISQAGLTQEVGLDVYPYTAGSTVLSPARVERAEKVLITWSVPRPEAAGRDLAELAAAEGVSVAVMAERLLPAGAIYFLMSEADVRRVLAHPEAMIGSDGLYHDARPHPRLWGTFPRVLGHYARDLGLFSLPEAVRRMTALPARRFGFSDRGRIRPGAHADLVLFDAGAILDRATYAEPDRPAAGVHAVLVAGTTVFAAGRPTGARPGRLLRRGDD
ncbi:MAG: D-aminoacylase [Alphaproteobacteria bacterium]|nr:D-aminoacylase [Alphaproteobacteria bacterium]